MSDQTRLFIWNNQNLFSNNYLKHRLPVTSLWTGQNEKAKAAFETAKKSYEIIKTLKLGSGQEAELEDKFIRPLLKALGYERSVQPTTQMGKRPDYALFKDINSLNAASSDKDNLKKFFSEALTILESKYWGRRLNDADKNDTLDSRDPTAQTIKYLDAVNYHTDGKINWAILTNGKHWRLFYYKAQSRSGNFYEIDLEEIIKKDSIEDFLYFYLFFSRDAFIPDAITGRTWLDQHLEGSEAYAKAVSERLKGLIFDNVFEGLAEGFIHYRRTELSITKESPESKKEIFKGCLTLLYRLLFLLYAESRNLLPIEEDGYYRVSLKKLKEDIYRDLSITGLDKMGKRSYAYWARLEGLFDIAAKGDPALNVPIYNGGLFENNPSIPPLEKGGKGGFDSFLSLHKMPDYHLAQAIEDLTVDQTVDNNILRTPFIDYSSLNVRHLGDIYEGLLEFHIEIADEKMVEVKEKGKFIWKRTAEVEAGAKTSKRKANGDVYIENSKHERKATGSYYTPHYIVEYIVKNTVGPALDEKIAKAKEMLNKLDFLYEKQRRELKKQNDWRHYEHPGEPKGKHIDEIIQKEKDVFETLFDIKVLDPAMGSGHFLVHTVDFISDKIISFLADYPENPVIRRIQGLKQEIITEIERQGVRIDEGKLTEINLIKRMVMKRCIYGVDLNEMAVELAKLSLWLDSFTLGAPLSFLDHHLKCGNSLIGILDISTVVLPNTEAYSKMQRALSFMLQVSELTDSTISEAKKSYELFKNAKATVEPIRRRFDVNTAQYFTDLGKNILSIENLAYSQEFEKETFPENVERCKKALSIASEKRFFHWRLEFPEVFYTEKGEKENPGFDCVIGNPPYDVLSEIEQERDIEPEKDFFSQSIMYKHAIGSKLNFYRLFSGLSLNLLKNKGEHGFIVPMALLADKQAKPLREHMLKKYSFQKIEAFPQKDDPANRVFFEAKLSTCVYILKKENPSLFSVRIHPGRDILETSTSLLITTSQIEEFDKENLSIPSYPNMTAEDFKLALRLNRVSQGSVLKDFAPSQQGEVNLTAHSEYLTDGKKGQIVLRGAHINRYEFQEEPKQGEPMYLDVKKFLDAHGKDTKAYDHRYIRIGYQRGAAIDNWRRIIATIIEKGAVCSDTINYIVNPKDYNLFAIFALLNSSLWEWRFRLTSTNNHVNSYEIDSMPMPPISFTTPEKERKKRVEEFKGMYKEWIKKQMGVK